MILEPGRDIYQADGLMLTSGTKYRAPVFANGDLLGAGFSCQSKGMYANSLVVAKSISDPLGEPRYRFEDLQPASVSRVQITRPLPSVTAQVEDQRVSRQRVIDAQRFVPCVSTPPRELAITGVWC